MLPPRLVAVIDHSVHTAAEQIFTQLPNTGEAARIRLHALNRGRAEENMAGFYGLDIYNMRPRLEEMGLKYV